MTLCVHREFLAPGAPCEINIDGKTMEKVHQEMKNPSRFTFDSAAEHVYTLLLKKDCYPRFIRSDQYRNLVAAGVQPLQKKRYEGEEIRGRLKNQGARAGLTLSPAFSSPDFSSSAAKPRRKLPLLRLQRLAFCSTLT